MSLQDTSTVVTPELLKRVRQIELRTRRIVTENLAGSYHSAFRGQGMEFDQVREYQPGDDVRAIDWNVTSRSSRPERKLFVKQFVEERELTVLLLADVSGSTDFGTGAKLKREVIAEIAALISFTAIRNRDRVGLIRFAGEVETYVPPRSGSNHVLRVIREILAPSSRGDESGPRTTDIAGALTLLSRVQRKPAVVFLLSDLRGPDFEQPLKLAARRHDLTVIRVGDRAENVVPRCGPILFEDPETGVRRVIDTSSKRVRRALEQAAKSHDEQTQAILERCRVDTVSIDASRDYEQRLVRAFRLRARRLNR